MAFSLQQLLAWWQDEGIGVRLHRADGEPVRAGALPAGTLSGAVIDSRQAGPGKLFCAVQGERVHGARFLGDALGAGCPAALVEGEAPHVEGSRAALLCVEDARAALAAAARGWLAAHGPRVHAITGSNGKTTTKDFTAAALGAAGPTGSTPGNLNSGWGLPLAILGQPEGLSQLVLEMGASGPGEIAALCRIAPPHAGCITNIAPAHLEAFGTVDAVLDTKAQLLDALPADGLCVLPADDPALPALLARAGDRPRSSFGAAAGADLQLTRIEQRRDGLRVELGDHGTTLPMFGRANAWNVAAACALAQGAGVGVDDALERLTAAPTSPHRGRLLARDGVVVLDDCYNANPASVGAALDSLAEMPVPGRRLAVLGDMAELGEAEDELHRATLAGARERGIELLPVGPRMSRAAAALGIPARGEGDEDLGAELGRTLRAGDAVLLKGSRSMRLERVLEGLGAERPRED